MANPWDALPDVAPAPAKTGGKAVPPNPWDALPDVAPAKQPAVPGYDPKIAKERVKQAFAPTVPQPKGLSNLVAHGIEESGLLDFLQHTQRAAGGAAQPFKGSKAGLLADVDHAIRQEGMAAETIKWLRGERKESPIDDLKKLNKDTLKQLADAFENNPEAFGQALSKGMIADPELFFAGPVAGGAVKALGATEKAAQGARLAAAVGTAAGVGAGSQEYEEGKINPKLLALQTAMAIPGAAAAGKVERGIGKLVKNIREKAAAPKITAEAPPVPQAQALAEANAAKRQATLAEDPKQHATYMGDEVDKAISDAKNLPRGQAKTDAAKALKQLKQQRSAKLTPEQAREAAARMRAGHPVLSDEEIGQTLAQHEHDARAAEEARVAKVKAREAYLGQRSEAAKLEARGTRAQELARQIAERPALPAPRMVEFEGQLIPESQLPEAEAASEARKLRAKYADQPTEPAPYSDLPTGMEKAGTVPESVGHEGDYSWIDDYGPGEARNKGAERVPEQDIPAGGFDVEAMKRDMKAYAKSQRGEIDPALAKKMGVTALAAAAGGLYFDQKDPIKGAVVGGLLALGAATPAIRNAALATAGETYTRILSPVNKVLEGIADVHGGLGKVGGAIEKKVGRTPYRTARAAAGVGAVSWFMDWEPLPVDRQNKEGSAIRRSLSAVTAATLAGSLRYMLGKGLSPKMASALKMPGLAGAGFDVPRATFTHVDELLLQNAAEKNIELTNTAFRLAAFDKLAHGAVIDGTVLKALEYAPERLAKLPPNVQEVVKGMREYYDKIGKQAVDSGVLKDLLERYVPHVFDMTDKHTADTIRALAERKSALGQSRYTRHRQLPFTIEELLDSKLGLKLKTKNANDVLMNYHQSMMQAIQDKRLIDNLGQIQGKNELPYVVDLKGTKGEVPDGYIELNKVDGLQGHPYLFGKAIDAQLVPYVRMQFQAAPPGTAAAIYDGINGAVKAVGVSASLFHVRSLFESALQGGVDPITAAKNMPAYLKQAAEGGAKNWQHAGLTLSAGSPTEFKSSSFSQKLYEKAERAGLKPIATIGKQYRKLNDFTEHLTFTTVQNGLKLQTAETMKSLLLERAAKRGIDLSPGQVQALEKQVAQYTNSLYGGINWTQEALSTESEMGFRIQAWMASPGGQRALRRVGFAPDWLYASLNVAAHATGLKPGPAELQSLYREAFYRNLIMTYAAKKALEKHWGTSDADAKHPSFNHVQAPDGRFLQIFKHGGEAQHFIEDPLRFAFNKLAPVPGTMVAVGADIAGRKPGRKITEDVAKRVAPFWAAAGVEGAQQGEQNVSAQQWVEDALNSVIGQQYYGKKKKED